MSVTDASRRLIGELTSLLDKRIKVILTDGRVYEGVLRGFDHPNLNVLLDNVVDSSGGKVGKVFIKGEKLSEIIALETPLFNPEEFRDTVIKEMRIPEHMIKVVPEAGAVVVQNRYRVTESGVEGTGPLAETLHEIYKRYMESKKRI